MQVWKGFWCPFLVSGVWFWLLVCFFFCFFFATFAELFLHVLLKLEWFWAPVVGFGVWFSVFDVFFFPKQCWFCRCLMVWGGFCCPFWCLVFRFGVFLDFFLKFLWFLKTWRGLWWSFWVVGVFFLVCFCKSCIF